MDTQPTVANSDTYIQQSSLTRDRTSSIDELSEAELAVAAYARKIADDASTITADDVEALRGHGLSDAEIFDIAAAAAGRAFFTKLLDALGVQADIAASKLNDDFRTPLTVGRPVSSEPAEYMEAD